MAREQADHNHSRGHQQPTHHSPQLGQAKREHARYATWTYRLTAIDVLEDCFVGRMFAYGSSGPLLRRLIILTATASRLHASSATCTSARSEGNWPNHTWR